MAHIEDTLCPHFTGHVGPVRFRSGHAETDDPELVDYFAGQPERYVITDTDEPADTDPAFECLWCDYTSDEYGDTHTHPEDDDPQE